MSESSFPFQGTAVADGPADLEETRGNRRTVLILAVVGVLVLGALAYFFVFSGGEDPADESLPVRRTPNVQVTPTPAATPVPVKAPKLTKKAFGKDPFKALVVAAPESDGAGAPAVGAFQPGNNVAGAGGNAGTPVGGGTAAGGTDDPGTSTKPVNVKVVSVASDNSSGRVTVGTKSYSVAVGDVFGTYFKVLRLKNGKCGSFTYGDERFDLCEGETSKMQ